MTRTTSAQLRPDYGIDAPGVIRNLLLVAVALVVAGYLTRHGIRIGRGAVVIQVHQMFYTIAGACVVEALLMVLYARVGKFRHRDQILALHDWRGDEQVLDVGTGRGLLLIGAARRLTTGTAVGIDIWRQEDLTGNTEDAALRNMRLEGVDRLATLRSMPAQAMTFGDNSFDVVVSNLCLHNIDARADRDAACREIVRVLKPGGVALISDFRHTEQYAAAFRAFGCTARRTGLDFWTFPWLRTVVATKN
ncbi:MAG TPA: class I SAM-dependent methyltransferase [Gemmatimonadales bacterium]|jgi:SAM-dependent methyltransferase